MRRIDACSCSPQSQRWEWKTSPVRHSECMRTRTFFLTRDVAFHQSDVLAVIDLVFEGDQIGTRRARWAAPTSAMRLTRRSVRSRYATICATVMNFNPCVCAKASSCGRRAIDAIGDSGSRKSRRPAADQPAAPDRPRLRFGRCGATHRREPRATEKRDLAGENPIGCDPDLPAAGWCARDRVR